MIMNTRTLVLGIMVVLTNRAAASVDITNSDYVNVL
jgi:hypothetical protein